MDRDGVKGLAALPLASLAGCFARVFKVAFTQNAGHVYFDSESATGASRRGHTHLFVDLKTSFHLFEDREQLPMVGVRG